MRLKDHKLTVEWNGERSRAENGNTGTCICGWSESHSTQESVRDEYRWHLKEVAREQEQASASSKNQS